MSEDRKFLNCYEADFDAWNATNNPERLPVLQRYPDDAILHPLDTIRGWVLREPPTQSDNWVQVPMPCRDSERDAERAANRYMDGLGAEPPEI